MNYRYLAFIIIILVACNNPKGEETASNDAEEPKIYTRLAAEQTGVDFTNKLYETFELNYYQFQYLYNGGGVAVGDINNDGLEDIYFTATQFSNKLYLNKGNMKFEDVTEKAGVLVGEGIKTGATMVDINNDGFLDIYVCRTGPENAPEKRTNLFYINNGDLTFTDKAAEMGLAEQCYSNHATFFDYDKDGDLDMYLLNHPTNFKKESRPRVVLVNGEYRRVSDPENEHEGDRLYRNDGGKFTDVTKKAGIINRAFGLSVGISDFNNDNYPDIFVANDYAEPDILYINNGDGTFSDKNEEYFKHTAAHSMGSDISDLNNDGLQDLLVLDMLPEDNRRQKLLATIMMYERYHHYKRMGFGDQLMRNVLQLNNGNGTFSEIGEMAGIAATDWSWGSLAADYDNDGWKDIFIANGYRRDVTNNDFVKFVKPEFNQRMQSAKSIYDILNLIPSEKTRNYIFKNNGDLTFKNTSYDWGLVEASYSNGTAYADLDNDGDLDLIVNNVDEPAFIYQSDASKVTGNHYLQVSLEGAAQNKRGIGATVTIEADGKTQVQEMRPTRGFFSSMPYTLHFGTGKATSIDKITVEWTDGKLTTSANVKADQKITLKYSEANGNAPDQQIITTFLASSNARIDFKHKENTDFIDFKREALLPHELSKEGPALAVGDVNADGKEDVFVGGAAGSSGFLYVQDNDGKLSKAASQPWTSESQQEDAGVLFFDADGDKDQDLYIVSGGGMYAANAAQYQDRLYLNDGNGNFEKAADALPALTSSGSCVAAADYDGDGDLDIFVGGRHIPNEYPYAPNSYILENNGGKFTDVTAQVASDLSKVGMVTDGIWTDLNGDKKLDLVVTGEWMPVSIFINNNGKLENQTEKWGLSAATGWWNCVKAADMDGDGDMDLVAGNLGLNSRMKASPSKPVEIFAKDIDNNGKLDPVVSRYVQNASYPIYEKSVISMHIPLLNQRFNRYEAFSKATTQQMFTSDEISGALKRKATHFATSYLENTGNGFKIKALPNLAQIAPTQAVLLKDFDKDGNIDILTVGNFYYPEVETGRYDAGTGLLLKGDGKGNFEPVPVRQSGFYAAKDARDMKMVTIGGKSVILVANNNDVMESFELRNVVQ